MKKHILKRSLAAVSMLFMTVATFAQASSSAYFLEGYNQRFQLNPALTPERNVYVAIPGLTNILVDAQGNVGISNFLFESTSKKGMLTTFMSPDVNASEFLDNLPETTQFNVGVSMDLFAVGIGTERSFTTFNVKLRTNEQVNLPKDLFGFMKSSLAQGDYLIKNVNVNSISYLEWSLTHSHKIGDHLTIGGGLKFIEGLAYADLTIDEMDARLAEDIWKVKTNGTLKASVPGAQFEYDAENKSLDKISFDQNNIGIPTSFGFAVDLGAEYDFKDLVKGLKVSSAITDIGAVKWTKLSTFATDNQQYVDFKGFKDYDVYGDNDDAVKKVGDDFKDLIRLNQTADDGSETIALDATFRLGASYDMPMVDWLSFGQLFTLRTGMYPYFESRTSVKLSPSDWFAVTGNLGFSNYGATMGLVLNFHPAGFNFFLAVDRIKADFNPQLIPMNDFGVDFSLGMSLAFGDKHN